MERGEAPVASWVRRRSRFSNSAATTRGTTSRPTKARAAPSTGRTPAAGRMPGVAGRAGAGTLERVIDKGDHQQIRTETLEEKAEENLSGNVNSHPA